MRSALAVLTLVLTGTTALAGSPDDILAANRAATGSVTGKAAVAMQFRFDGSGLTGTAGGISDLNDGRFEQDFDIGPQKGANGFDGTHVWNKDNAGIVTLQEAADTIPLAVNNAYRNADLWWRPDHGGAAIALDPQKTDGGNSYDVLTVTPTGGKAFDAWFDAGTHLLYRTVELQANVTVTTTTTNYKPFDGVQEPVDTTVSTGGDAKYDQHLTLSKVTFLTASDPAVYAPPKSAPPDFAIAGGAHSVTLPFDLVSNHIYAHVMINGKGPYVFVFDTGGVNIVTPELAKQLGLETKGHMEGRGAGEATMDFGFTHVDKIALGAASIDDQSFAVFPLDSLYVADGQHMPGMVGYETFRRFVTSIDYGNRTVTLTDPKYFDSKGSGAPVRIAFNGNAVIVAGTYAGIPAKFQIDTGSRSALTLDAPFVAANHLDGSKGVDAVEGWGVGGPSRSHVTRGDALKVADAISVDHPVVGMATDKKGAFADPTISGNIGGGVLKRYVVTFDYANNTMYVKPTTGSVADLDTYDRAGSWFNVDGDDFKVIDVTKGGPAEQAGLKPGDVIVAIDGTAAKDLHLYAVRQRLRDGAPGTVVDFRLKDGRDLKVTLRDQI